MIVSCWKHCWNLHTQWPRYLYIEGACRYYSLKSVVDVQQLCPHDKQIDQGKWLIKVLSGHFFQNISLLWMWRQLGADYLIQTSSSMRQDNNMVLVFVLSPHVLLVLLLSVWGLHNLLGSVWSIFHVLLESVQSFCVLLVLLLLMWCFHVFPVSVRCFHIVLPSLCSLHVLVSVWSIRVLLVSEWFSLVSYHSKKGNILSIL